MQVASSQIPCCTCCHLNSSSVHLYPRQHQRVHAPLVCAPVEQNIHEKAKVRCQSALALASCLVMCQGLLSSLSPRCSLD